MHDNERMQWDFTEKGEDMFLFELTKIVDDLRHLSSVEQVEIDEAMAAGLCYNKDSKSNDIWTAMHMNRLVEIGWFDILYKEIKIENNDSDKLMALGFLKIYKAFLERKRDYLEIKDITNKLVESSDKMHAKIIEQNNTIAVLLEKLAKYESAQQAKSEFDQT